jgi:hypothetical protein
MEQHRLFLCPRSVVHGGAGAALQQREYTSAARPAPPGGPPQQETSVENHPVQFDASTVAAMSDYSAEEWWACSVQDPGSPIRTAARGNMALPKHHGPCPSTTSRNKDYQDSLCGSRVEALSTSPFQSRRKSSSVSSTCDPRAIRTLNLLMTTPSSGVRCAAVAP